MPNEIDAIFDEAFAGKRIEKGPYQPERGEEAIFAAPEKGLLDYLAPLLPFYSQVTGQTPWRSPETAMEAIGWGTGGLMRGPGMVKAALPKGASSIRKALEEIGANLFRKGGVPATIEKGPLPALGGGRFQRMGAEDVIEAIPRRVPQKGQIAGAIERKQLPRAEGYPGQRASYAGPTAPRGIPQPYAPQTWRERTFPGTIKRAQDVIEDLFRESLRAKGMID